MDNKNLTLLNRIQDSDIYFSFIKSPTAILSTIILIIIFFFLGAAAGMLNVIRAANRMQKEE